MIDFKIEKNKDETVLTIIGDTTIENALFIKGKFLEFVNNNNLIVNLNNIQKTDLSFIQLIVSLINEFENNKSGKLSFIFKNQDSIIVRYLKNYGFSLITDIQNYFQISGD